MQTKEFSNSDHTLVVRTNSSTTINRLTKDFEEVSNGTMKKVLQIHKPKVKSSYNIKFFLDSLKFISPTKCKHIRIGFSHPYFLSYEKEPQYILSFRTETGDPERQVEILIAPFSRRR